MASDLYQEIKRDVKQKFGIGKKCIQFNMDREQQQKKRMDHFKINKQ